MTAFTDNGLIATNGKWINCAQTQHMNTRIANTGLGPFVECRTGDTAEFEAFYTVDHTLPTQAQFETLVDWCTAMGERFEDVTDCWRKPWQKWRGDD
jgi:hypothetical protein